MRLSFALFTILGTACTAPNPLGGGVCPDEDPAPPPRPPPGGRARVAYVTTVNDLPQLWMLDLDQPAADPVRLDAIGSGPGPLAPQWGPSLVGIWSPAGGEIAVRLGDTQFGPAALGVIDVAAPGIVRNVGAMARVSFFPWFEAGEGVWSPEGDRLVAADRTADTVWVVRTDGGGETRVASDIGDPGDVSFSPDGRFVGISASDGTGGFHVTPADAEAPREIARDSYWWGPAGSQVIGYLDEQHWEISDVGADVREVVPAAAGSPPVFSSDGAWLLSPGPPLPELRRRGCGEPIALADAPRFVSEAKATADGNHIVFTGVLAGGGVDSSSAWVADRVGDTWQARQLYAPSTPMRRVDWPIVSQTGARVAWLLGGNSTDRFLVTHENVRDPAAVTAAGIVQPVVLGTYWFSPDLRRLAYLAGTAAAPTLRVLDIRDPSAPVLLGELAGPDGRPITWVTWSRTGNAFGYYVDEVPLEAPLVGDLYVVRVADGTLETPRLVGSTRNQMQVSFHWEP